MIPDPRAQGSTVTKCRFSRGFIPETSPDAHSTPGTARASLSRVRQCLSACVTITITITDATLESKSTNRDRNRNSTATASLRLCRGGRVSRGRQGGYQALVVPLAHHPLHLLRHRRPAHNHRRALRRRFRHRR
eukprot:1477369-Rhodomonas_salina.1